MGGLPSAASDCPSRFGEGNNADQARTTPPYADLRDAVGIHSVLSSTPGMKKNDMMKIVGMASFTSLWELEWYIENYFNRLGLCYLHNESHGNW